MLTGMVSCLLAHCADQAERICVRRLLFHLEEQYHFYSGHGVESGSGLLCVCEIRGLQTDLVIINKKQSGFSIPDGKIVVEIYCNFFRIMVKLNNTYVLRDTLHMVILQREVIICNQQRPDFGRDC